MIFLQLKRNFFKYAIFLYACFFPLQFVYAAQELKPEIVETLTPKLNSDRITYFFGNYGVEQLSMNSCPFKECRIANLYSSHHGQKIMRTLAVVQFHQPIHHKLERVHQKIVQGESIGLALQKDGWKLDKVPLYFGSIALSPQVQALMQEQESDLAALHIYKLVAFADNEGERMDYCTIMEVHSPKYLDKQWLEALYQDQYRNFQDESQEVKRLLDPLNTLIQQFPRFTAL